MKRANRAALTAAALLSCTLTFSGCSLIGQVVPDQDGTAGEQAEADGQQSEGQQPEGQQTTGENEASQDSGAGGESSDASSSAEGTSSGADDAVEGTADSDNGTTGSDAGQSSGSQAEVSIGESFEDPEMQDKIEVLSAVRNLDRKSTRLNSSH